MLKEYILIAPIIQRKPSIFYSSRKYVEVKVKPSNENNIIKKSDSTNI